MGYPESGTHTAVVCCFDLPWHSHPNTIITITIIIIIESVVTWMSRGYGVSWIDRWFV